MMTIQLPADLESTVQGEALRLGVTPESLVEEAVRARFSSGRIAPQPSVSFIEPIDDWERRLLAIAVPCDVILPNEALSRENLYD
jgi:hypothetical protein